MSWLPTEETKASETSSEPLIWVESVNDLQPNIEQQRQQVRKHHWTMLVLSFVVLLLACLMQIQNSERVAFLGFSRYPLPELCGSRLLFNTECPGCGLTRSFIALAAMDWETSLQFHRIGWLLALAVVLQIPYRIFRLQRSNSQVSKTRWPVWCGNLLITLLVGNWFVKVFLGL